MTPRIQPRAFDNGSASLFRRQLQSEGAALPAGPGPDATNEASERDAASAFGWRDPSGWSAARRSA
jgi:hypothetical protein